MISYQIRRVCISNSLSQLSNSLICLNSPILTTFQCSQLSNPFNSPIPPLNSPICVASTLQLSALSKSLHPPLLLSLQLPCPEHFFAHLSTSLNSPILSSLYSISEVSNSVSSPNPSFIISLLSTRKCSQLT